LTASKPVQLNVPEESCKLGGRIFFSMARANAQFDPYTNVYFKNNQLFNKIQWDAATAILIGFPVQNHSIQLGPQIQYSLSSLLKDNSTYPGHLIYFGLKCSFSR
jgi:calcineurin-like phosphoesterase family protein